MLFTSANRHRCLLWRDGAGRTTPLASCGPVKGDRHREIDPEIGIVEHGHKETTDEIAYQCAIQTVCHEEDKTAFGQPPSEISDPRVDDKGVDNHQPKDQQAAVAEFRASLYEDVVRHLTTRIEMPSIVLLPIR